MLNPTENALDEATVIMVKQLYYLRTREAVTEQITRPLNVNIAAVVTGELDSRLATTLPRVLVKEVKYSGQR